MKFDKQSVVAARTAIQKHLDKLDLGGLTISVGNASFSEGQVTFKLEVKTDDPMQSREAEAYRAYQRMGILPDRLGQSFRHPSVGLVTVMGYMPRRSKKPVLTRTPEGKEYIFAESILTDARTAWEVRS